MDVLAPFSDPLLAAVAVLVVHFLSRGRFRSLEQRADQVGQRIDKLETLMNARFDAIDARFDALRSDLTRIALAVGVRREPEAG